MEWGSNGPRSRQQKILEGARRLFESSEKVLRILRTQTATRIKRPTDQEVREWYTNLNRKR